MGDIPSISLGGLGGWREQQSPVVRRGGAELGAIKNLLEEGEALGAGAAVCSREKNQSHILYFDAHWTGSPLTLLGAESSQVS